MRKTYEVIGSFSYVNLRGVEPLVYANGNPSGRFSSPKEVQATHSANILAKDAEQAISLFKDLVEEFAEEHHYANGGDRFNTDLVAKFCAIESVALLAVDVYE
jgi:hypothetical protein